MMQDREQTDVDVAVLVVHGIGAQEPGETLGKLLNGLRRVHGDAIPATAHDGVVANLGGRRARFHEVYWADLLRGDITYGGFQIMELQSLSWFPWLNLRRGNYRPGCCSNLKLMTWCLALPVINFLVLLAYYGAGLVVEVASGLSGARARSDTESAGRWSRMLHKAGAKSRAHTRCDAILDEYVGDVFSYVNSAGGAFHREEEEPAVPEQVVRSHAAIMQRFYDQLVKAAAGCESIQIVAHSLGTVVTYHALSGLDFDALGREDAAAVRAAAAKVRHLYTIGSPLEKIRFFWPTLTRAESLLGGNAVRWDNFVSWFDPVAGRLGNFGDWAKLINHRLLGGGFFRGHVVYEHSPVFMNALTRGLCDREIPLARSFKERVLDLLILVGETLLAPMLLAVVLLLGAAVFALTVSLLPYLLSLPLRLFMAPGTWGPIVDALMYILAGMMFLALFLAPIVRACKVHARYWAAPSADPVTPAMKG